MGILSGMIYSATDATVESHQRQMGYFELLFYFFSSGGIWRVQGYGKLSWHVVVVFAMANVVADMVQ
jgi:hypothetical protein